MTKFKRLVLLGLAGATLFVGLSVFADVKDPATIKTDATADLATNTEMFLQPTIDVIDSINIKYADNTAMEAGGTSMPNGTTVYLLGHTTTNDGGEGTFVLDTSAADVSAENDGTIFASAGGTDWYWRRTLVDKTITPQMFGAVVDNSTDDASEIQAAADACNVLNSGVDIRPTLFFPPGFYRTLSTITVLVHINIDMVGEIVYAGGSESAAALVVGVTNISNQGVELKLKVHRSSVSDWTNEGSIGIKLINTIRSQIWVDVSDSPDIATNGFTIGLQCLGSATGTSDKGFTNNNVFIGGIFNCKYAVDLSNDSASSGNGYTNSNRFFGGSISQTSGTGKTGLSRYGYRLISSDGNNKNVNNNTVYGTAIELDDSDASPGEAIPILIHHGQDNMFKDLRNESNNTIVARILDDPTSFNRDNHIEWTHTAGTIDDQSRQASTTGGFNQSRSINRPLRLVFDSGPMDRNLHYFNGNTTIHIPDVHLMVSSGGGTVSDNITDAGITAFVSETFTVDTGTEEIIDTAHEMRVDDIIFFTTTGALPTSSPQITVTAPAYVISTITDRFKISDTKGGSEITFSAGGSPTNTYEGRTRYVTLEVNYGVGVYVDTSQCKQLTVVRDIDVDSANGGRIAVIPYTNQGVRLVDDVTFTVVQATSNVNLNATAHGMPNGEKIYLDSSTNDLPLNLLEDLVYYVVNQTANDFEVSLTSGGSSVTFDDDGSGTLEFSLVDRWVKSSPPNGWVSVFGGAYWNGNNLTKDYSLWVRSEVKYVNLIVVCATGSTSIRKFQIHVPESEPTPDVWVGYKSGVTNRFFATVAPTEGVYTDLGLQIAENVPTGAATLGWVLTTIGAPGTWAPLPNLPLSGSTTFVGAVDIQAGASVVGLNIDLDATPGSAFTVLDSGSSELFEVTPLGHVNVGGGTPDVLHQISIDVTGELAQLNVESQDDSTLLILDSGGADKDSIILFRDDSTTIWRFIMDTSLDQFHIFDDDVNFDYLTFDRSPVALIVNNDDADMDFIVKASGVANALVVQGSDGNVGVGILAPTSGLEMGNDVLLARDTNAGLTAGTTQTQAGGLALTAQVNQVATVANTSDTVVLPILPATGSLQVVIINSGANTMRVFPASGDNLGAGANLADSVNIPTGTVRKYISYDATNWVKYISE